MSRDKSKAVSIEEWRKRALVMQGHVGQLVPAVKKAHEDMERISAIVGKYKGIKGLALRVVGSGKDLRAIAEITAPWTQIQKEILSRKESEKKLEVVTGGKNADR